MAAAFAGVLILLIVLKREAAASSYRHHSAVTRQDSIKRKATFKGPRLAQSFGPGSP
ncbi:hypothetical protein [Paraburkholderia sp. CI3]|uniref:hypothetical protein n=1 Tax=Paraburkholderia sp. CI3 TaxID=2991060 RepID=UPI003D2554E8